MIPENKIICGDCLEVMKDWPDNCVDLVLTSPPYNTGGKSLGYHPNSKTGDSFYDHYLDKMRTDRYEQFVLDSVKKTLMLARYSFWNMQILSGNKRTVLHIMSVFSNNLKDVFIWRKQAVSQITKGRIAKGFEVVALFGQDDDMTFEYRNFPDNNYVPNIQTWYKNDSMPEHHATFPIELPLYFIKYFTKPDDIVLDCFSGIGTTCVAAKMLGRKYIGIDISEKYCDIARMRLKAVDTGVPVKEQQRGQMGLFK